MRQRPGSGRGHPLTPRRNTALALALAVAALLLPIAIAEGAPPTDLTVGQSSRVVTASWTLPPGWYTGRLEFANSPATGSDGSFTDPTTIYHYESPQRTFDSSPFQFPPGTYYVHVSAIDPICDPSITNCTEDFSTPPAVLTVPDAPPAPPPPPSPPPDKVTAFASLSAPSSQRLTRLYVRAEMAESGTITAGGTVKVPKLSTVYMFKTISAPAVAGVSVKLKLKLPKKAFRAVKRALKRHRKMKAKIAITATDKAQNKKTAHRTIKLKL